MPSKVTEQHGPAEFATLGTVCDFTTKSKPTIYRWVKLGRFPAPVKIGPNSVAWRWGDLRTWAADPAAWQAGAAQ